MSRRSAARRRPRQGRSRATVEAILDAVSRVLREAGPRAVTTNRVAEVAGVSIGTLYQYFADKQSIFDALHERHLSEIGVEFQRALIRHAEGPLDALLIALVDGSIAAHARDPELHALLSTQVPQRPGASEAETARLMAAFRLAVASHRDELRPGCDLGPLVFVLAHMIEGLTHAAVLHRPRAVSLETARDEIVAAMTAYLDLHRR